MSVITNLDLSEWADRRLMVVGDLMLDEYLWGQVDRISPEAPVQVVEVVRETTVLGGAGNVVRNLTSLGAQVLTAGAIGDDEAGDRVVDLLASEDQDVSGLVKITGRRTGLKSRIMAGHQQVVRIDRESTKPLTGEQADIIYSLAKSQLDSLDALILSDYAKGVLTDNLTGRLIDLFFQADKPVVVDPKGTDYTRYRKASVLTPNEKEARLALGLDFNDSERVAAQVAGHLNANQWPALMITRGSQGMSLFRASANPVHVPARARQVFDVSGAGDTFVAVTGLGMACGWHMEEVARLANLAGAVVVGKVGTASLTVAELSLADRAERPSKIVPLAEVEAAIDRYKAQGKRIVFTNGCFDLLHSGHIHLFQKSKELGEVLVVGLDDDESVTKLKGVDRPIIDQGERARIIGALDQVDLVTIFPSDKLVKLLTRLAPDVLTKGGNYSIKQVVGHEVVESKGGRVELIPLEGDLTTSDMVNRVRSNGK